MNLKTKTLTPEEEQRLLEANIDIDAFLTSLDTAFMDIVHSSKEDEPVLISDIEHVPVKVLGVPTAAYEKFSIGSRIIEEPSIHELNKNNELRDISKFASIDTDLSQLEHKMKDRIRTLAETEIDTVEAHKPSSNRPYGWYNDAFKKGRKK